MKLRLQDGQMSLKRVIRIAKKEGTPWKQCHLVFHMWKLIPKVMFLGQV